MPKKLYIKKIYKLKKVKTNKKKNYYAWEKKKKNKNPTFIHQKLKEVSSVPSPQQQQKEER